MIAEATQAVDNSYTIKTRRLVHLELMKKSNSAMIT